MARKPPSAAGIYAKEIWDAYSGLKNMTIAKYANYLLKS